MPTTTFTITTTNNDGAAYSGTPGISQPSVAQFNSSNNSPWWIFKGITIQQGATITSAFLNVYALFSNPPVNSASLNVVMDKATGVTIPTNWTQVLSPATFTQKFFLWGSSLPPSPGTQTLTVPYGSFNPANYGLAAHNIQSLVQTLVNNNSYSNDNMAVYLHHVSGANAYVYLRNSGSTKAATLAIGFEVPLSLVDLTFKSRK
jgi:hypothetical protein